MALKGGFFEVDRGVKQWPSNLGRTLSASRELCVTMIIKVVPAF